jgi:hypothetical protein
MECGASVVNHVKIFFVRTLRKNFNLKFSLFAISPASVKYRVICSTLDSLVSPANVVNLGILKPLGSSVCKTYYDKEDTKFGLCNPMFKQLRAITVSTKLAKLLRAPMFCCYRFLTTSSASWFLFTKTTSGCACIIGSTGWG